jgi:glycosyltransferase involved in cell wall biosynthesis
MPIDILLPYWGDPSLLKATVQSVLDQRSDDWKLTVVDDCYPDPTVAEWFGSIEDERIRYVRHESNVGITENYVRCRELATEDLLVFLGCDDLLHPDYVDVVQAAHAAYPEASIIQPGVDVIDENGARIDPLTDRIKRRVMPEFEGRQLLSGEPLAASLLRGNWLYWPSLVFRRDELMRFEFREGLPIIQDLAIVVDMIHDGCSLLVDDTVCFSYRRHVGSASSATIASGSRFKDDRRYFELAARQARERGWRRAERAARMRLTSRAHALSLLPSAVLRGKVSSVAPLLNHAFHP